ncbi:HEAT repeat domain-containing protein [Dactylosporangium matsuzakiense]|uniref:Transcriptional regulator n=1 Tax=Dactylosporangium matsuzakiense TaxID=53360 RepID=A0A9W6NS83_9ACTN|nr:HEAT repeat domain-containing protein [Dactylosporangium matsuzakiense]UWZ48194.1 MerR family transcriptional regulator [Dactylosporangium matsuzakiense]GLL08080.1 transcriptional regulator [Dactylosporangium matsuzakiense]
MLIGDVARRSGVSARMLRHYDQLGLVRPTGRSGAGYREYSDEDIRRIFHIESLRSLGLSLKDVKRALDDPAFTPAGLVDDLIRQTRDRIAREQELLTRLGQVGAAGPADWADVLQIIALLQALGSDSAGRRQRAALSSASTDEMPVEALVEAALHESDPVVAGSLRWALAQSGDAALALLSDALDSPATDVRRRAAQCIAEFPPAAAAGALRTALTNDDLAVRRYAALALGPRGEPATIPTLIAMVVDEVNDVEASDALSGLAAAPDLAEHIASAISGEVARSAGDPSARRRLTQALADIPGPTATSALTALAADEDRGVAVTAAYVLRLRAR